MALAIFDLDHTLINGDCVDYWVDYCINNNLTEDLKFYEKNKHFTALYGKGELDIHEYIAFSMKPICCMSASYLSSLIEDFLLTMIKPTILDKAIDIVKFHIFKGDTPIIISASPNIFVEPITSLFNIHHSISINLKRDHNLYRNSIEGTAPYKEGKIECLMNWLTNNSKYDLIDSYFYTDSHNDIPLLKIVDNPIATNPDPLLLEHAKIQNWQTIATL